MFSFQPNVRYSSDKTRKDNTEDLPVRASFAYSLTYSIHEIFLYIIYFCLHCTLINDLVTLYQITCLSRNKIKALRLVFVRKFIVMKYFSIKCRKNQN